MSYRFWTWNPSYMLSKRLSVMVSFNPLIPPILGVVKKLGDTPITLGRSFSLYLSCHSRGSGNPGVHSRVGYPTASSTGTASTPVFNPSAPSLPKGDSVPLCTPPNPRSGHSMLCPTHPRLVNPGLESPSDQRRPDIRARSLTFGRFPEAAK